jgi:IS1 family transposase
MSDKVYPYFRHLICWSLDTCQPVCPKGGCLRARKEGDYNFFAFSGFKSKWFYPSRFPSSDVVFAKMALDTGAKPNLTLADISCRSSCIDNVKTNRGSTWFGMKVNAASAGSPHDNSWPILQNQGFIRNFPLLFHESKALLHFRYRIPSRLGLQPNYESGYCSYAYEHPIGPLNGCIPFWCFLAIVLCYGSGALITIYGERLGFSDRASNIIGLSLTLGIVPIWFAGRVLCEAEHEQGRGENYSHSSAIVLQKYLDKLYSCSTVIDMANVLSKDKQIAVVSALAEGSSIRSIERMTGINRNTIMTLGVRVGKGCTALLDAKMRDLPCRYLQFDEVWGFIGKKERHVRPDDDPQYGDVWTFCAIDAETKLVPSFKCGKRNLATAKVFVGDVASRMRTRVQISSDALRAYVDAIEQVYGADVDYGQIVKNYEHDDAQNAERKYSAARFVSVEKRSVTGSPDMDLVSTSYIERLNATTRLHMRRLTRLTLAFSKKFENFEAAVGLHFAYYNLVKRHGSLRMTPAMAAGIERDFWSVGDLVEAAA